MNEEAAASPAPRADYGFERLHISAIPIGLAKAARAWLVPMLLLLLFSRGDGSGFALPLSALALAISAATTVIHVATLRYGLVGDRFVVRSGLLFRQNRTIPLSRLQKVDLEQDLLHRIFGVVEVRLETAGGAGRTEAQLVAVATDRARRLREQLLGQREGPIFEAPREVILRQVTMRELLLLGATANRIGVIVAFFFGILEFTSDLGDDVRDAATSVSSRLIGAGSVAQSILAIAGALLVVAGGWGVSIVSTLIQHYRFTLSWTGSALRRRHGLFTRFEVTVPLDRVQALRFERSWPRRLLGYATVRVHTAGSAKEKERSGTTVLFPIAKDDEVAWFARLVFPALALDELELSPVHVLARRRGFVRFLLLGLVAATLVWALFDVAPWILFLPWIPCAAGLAARRYRVLGYALTGEHLISQFGLWTRHTWIVPLRKVQAVSVVASPMQRSLGLATLQVANAGHGSAGLVTIVDLAAPLAEALREHISRESARTASRRDSV